MGKNINDIAGLLHKNKIITYFYVLTLFLGFIKLRL